MSLREHQIEGINFLIANQGGIIGDEMGTGKTRLSLAFAKWLYHKGHIDRVLVVCPARLQFETWEQEVIKYYGVKPTVYAKKRKLDINSFVTIVSYGRLRYKHKKYFKHLDIIQEHFSGMRLLVILDEAHNITNDESDTAVVCRELDTVCRVAMTGTPIQNKPENLFGILSFIDPKIEKQWFINKFLHRRLITIPTKYGRRKVWDITGYKNQDQLHTLLKRYMIRRTLDECVDLPPMVDNYIGYEMTDPLYRDVYGLCEMNDETPMVRCIRLQQAASGIDPFDDMKSFRSGAKFEMLQELVKNRSGKMVIWFNYVTSLDAVKKILSKENDVYEWSGRNTVHRREQADNWRKSDNALLLLTFGAGAEGIELVEGRTAIFYEYGLSPSTIGQAQARLHRSGQSHRVTNFCLYGRGTVEEGIIQLVRRKKHINDVVVDGDFTTEELREIYSYNFKLQLGEG